MEEYRNESNKQKNNDGMYRLLKVVSISYRFVAALLIVSSFGLVLTNYSTDIWYRVDASAVESDTRSLLKAVNDEEIMSLRRDPKSDYSKAKKLPPIDKNLPTEPTLIIPSIGVNGRLHEGEDIESELKKGLVRHHGAGTPMSNNQMPVLLMAHRFGYASWSESFRNSQSFRNLPDLNPGDEIIYVYQQRAFRYKVTRVFESESIVSVQEDMILYTCKFFNNEKRIVVTANLI